MPRRRRRETQNVQKTPAHGPVPTVLVRPQWSTGDKLAKLSARLEFSEESKMTLRNSIAEKLDIFKKRRTKKERLHLRRYLSLLLAKTRAKSPAFKQLWDDKLQGLVNQQQKQETEDA